MALLWFPIGDGNVLDRLIGSIIELFHGISFFNLVFNFSKRDSVGLCVSEIRVPLMMTGSELTSSPIYSDFAPPRKVRA